MSGNLSSAVKVLCREGYLVSFDTEDCLIKDVMIRGRYGHSAGTAHGMGRLLFPAHCLVCDSKELQFSSRLRIQLLAPQAQRGCPAVNTLANLS